MRPMLGIQFIFILFYLDLNLVASALGFRWSTMVNNVSESKTVNNHINSTQVKSNSCQILTPAI